MMKTNKWQEFSPLTFIKFPNFKSFHFTQLFLLILLVFPIIIKVIVFVVITVVVVICFVWMRKVGQVVIVAEEKPAKQDAKLNYCPKTQQNSIIVMDFIAYDVAWKVRRK